MDLYILRHGVAMQRGEWEGDDALRPLTVSGMKDMAREARFFAKLGLALDAILTSPLTRAFQTAEIVADHLNLRDKLIAEPALGPDFGPRRLSKLLRSYPEAGALMLVGHEPSLSQTIGYLVGGRVILRKGGLAYVQLAEDSFNRSTLAWLLQPKVMGL
jgi:phosphohistidine phosphatase